MLPFRIACAALLLGVPSAATHGIELPWTSPGRCRVVLRVDPVRGDRSNSPATIEFDPVDALASRGLAGRFDEHAVEVMTYDVTGAPLAFDASRGGYERFLVPHRVERAWATSRVSVHFVVPDARCAYATVSFDTVESGLGRPGRYDGLVGDGDFFRHAFGRREIGASHFDTFCDLDGDGDLDLFRGGVEPFIHCFENVGGPLRGHRLAPRGRLTSDGEPITLPHNSRNGRSWVLPHFHDLDGDGDQDFFPSFLDGPMARRVVHFENVTAPGGALTFIERGPLATAAGTPVAAGETAGGWFPSVVFIERLDVAGERRVDLVLGSNNRAYFYRCEARASDGAWRWADPVALEADGAVIELFNPCFAAADIDGDGDQDLFAAPQAGQILLYENTSDAAATLAGDPPRLAAGVVVAHDDIYTMPSTHPRVTVADFTGDGLLDFVVDRAWELADLRRLAGPRDFGALFANVGSRTEPRWERRDAWHGAPYTEEHQMCDALRQNVVRAVDWDRDGRLDLLAGDCDGFVWLFRNETGRVAPLFAPGERLMAGGATLDLSGRNGHARPDVCDWNDDGHRDLVVADGAGGVTIYFGRESDGVPILAAGERLHALDASGAFAPIQRGTRAHLLVCDWNDDGLKDLVFSDQENPGFFLFENIGERGAPRLAAPRSLGLTPYMRPNLGAFVDWDGDGRRDFVGCEFEHSIRLYRDTATTEIGGAPVLAPADGVPLIKPSTIMMISGADVVDWNGDGDLDVITGQGHAGSGLRFYERDFIEDTIRGTHPRVEVVRVEDDATRFLDVVRRYADAMLAHGRDVWGPRASGLFLSALDRAALRPLTIRPAPPGGIRRGDRAGLPWLELTGANPHTDENLLRCLSTLRELTGDARYAAAADHEIRWFFENTQSPATGLLPWGEHLSWDSMRDRAISSGGSWDHEFARPWVLWDRTFELAPAAATRFALGLWEHQIADHQTGAFDRHAPYDRHGPRDGKDFARHAGFYIHTWAHAYRHTRDGTFLRAIETLLARYERKRAAGGDAPASTLGPLDVATAARLVPEPLAARLREFAAEEDGLVLAELRRAHAAPDGAWAFEPTWQAGYSSGATAGIAMFGLARHEQTGDAAFRELVIVVADAYAGELPAEDVDVWPMTFGHVISAQVAAYRFTGELRFLAEGVRFARLAVALYFQDSPLPRASLKTGHYETITGCDSLALALLDLHVARGGLDVDVPSNTIDR